MRGNVTWAGIVVAVSLAAGYLVATTTPTLVFVAVIGAFVVFRWPTATVVALLTACQEISPTSSFGVSASPLQSFGHQLYFTAVGKIPVLELVLGLGAVAGLAHARQWKASARATWLLTGCGVVVVGVAYLQGLGALTSIGQYGRPFIIAVLAMGLAATTDCQPGGWRLVFGWWLGASALVMLVGLYLFATGKALPTDDGAVSIFYDSALPALAGAVLLAVLLGPLHTRYRVPVVTIIAAIVLLSGRRNVWLALAVALLLTLLARRGRVKNVIRVAVGLGVALVVAQLLFPGAVAGAGSRMLAALGVASGTATEVSTSQHLNDLTYGWMYVQQSPFLGMGATHDPLPGLAVQQGYMYVHNELLLDWLRFGILGALAVGVPMIVGAFVALRRLRQGAGGVPAVGALFLLVAPVCAMSAAFFSTTQRWPALLGLAAGMLLQQSRPGDADAADVKSLVGGARGEGARVVVAGPPAARRGTLT